MFRVAEQQEAVMSNTSKLVGFCRECGWEIYAGQKFCPEWGLQINPSNTMETTSCLLIKLASLTEQKLWELNAEIPRCFEPIISAFLAQGFVSVLMTDISLPT
jgi:hypothetical protein